MNNGNIGNTNPHPYVGMWVTKDGYIRHGLLPNGRYDESRGNRRRYNFMSAIAYLNFDGIAEKAIEFYSEALKANEVKKVKFKDFSQDPNYLLPENELNMIMECSVEFTGGKIMMSDILPSMKAVTGELVNGNNVHISLVIADKQTLEEYFNNLSVGGNVIMPLSNTPWSSCFGMLVDKFGVSWKFNCDADKFLDTVISNKQ